MMFGVSAEKFEISKGMQLGAKSLDVAVAVWSGEIWPRKEEEGKEEVESIQVKNSIECKVDRKVGTVQFVIDGVKGAVRIEKFL